MNKKSHISNNRQTRAARRKKEMKKRKTTSFACSINAYSTTYGLLYTWCSIMMLRFKSITRDLHSKWWLLLKMKVHLLIWGEKPRSRGSRLLSEPGLFEANYNSVYKTTLSMRQYSRKRSAARLSLRTSLQRHSGNFFPSISVKSWQSGPSLSLP